MNDETTIPTSQWYMAVINGTTAVPMSIAKLIDTVGDQIGLFLEPTHVRRMGNANAAAKIAEAKAKADIAIIRLDSRYAIQQIEDRTMERVERRELQRQKNIENIVEKAAGEIPESVSESPVDKDWIAHFLSLCQDVSNEEMQTVWARLLAGEVANPGAFSPRTLSVVRLMKPGEAGLFTRLCQAAWHRDSSPIIVIPRIEDANKLGDTFDLNVTYADFIQMESQGLIKYSSLGAFGILLDTPGKDEWEYFGKTFTITHPTADRINFGMVILTQTGKELVSIAGSAPNEKLREWFIDDLRKNGWSINNDNSGPGGTTAEIPPSATDNETPEAPCATVIGASASE